MLLVDSYLMHICSTDHHRTDQQQITNIKSDWLMNDFWDKQRDRRDWFAIAILSLFLPSVKQGPRGDGFCLRKKRINGSCKEGVGGDQIVPRLPPQTQSSDALLWAGWRWHKHYWQGSSRRWAASASGGPQRGQRNSLHTCFQATKCTQTYN